MMVAVLADGPNYEYYPQKLTTGPETIERRFSDSWGGAFVRSKIVRGLYYRVQSKPFLFKLISRKTAACYSAACFICAELKEDEILVPEELHLDILQSLYTCI
jgi:hypothetical protein